MSKDNNQEIPTDGVGTVYITSSHSSWSDHKRSDSSTEILATTTDLFTAYAIAIEAWINEYIDSERHVENPNEWYLFENIDDALKNNDASSLLKLHQSFVEYANENWINEYGGSVSFYVSIEEVNLTPTQNKVQAKSFFEYKIKSAIWGYLNDELTYSDVAEFCPLMCEISVGLKKFNQTGFVQKLSRLSNLERLKLTAAYNYEEDVSEDIGLLPSLKHLELEIKGSNIPNSIGNLTHLEIIEIWKAENIEQLPESFGNLINLKKLKIRFAYSLTSLPESFSQLESLEELVLESCMLTTLPKGFGNLHNLKIMSIDMSYRFDDVFCLPEDFTDLCNLNSLSLNALDNLPDSFWRLQALKYVNFSNAALSCLPPKFGELQLETLKLRNSKPIPNALEDIASIQTLKELVLTCELTHIPSTIQQCKQLSYLNLSNNKIANIPFELGEVVALERLALSDNNITSVPSSLVTLEHLHFFSLRENPLSAETKQWLNEKLRFTWT